jgi:hypothetical protein
MTPHLYTEASIISQLADITATSEDGAHLILVDRVDIVLPTREVVSPKAASAYLYVGEWTPTPTCSDSDCILPAHAASVTPVTEDEEDAMVRKASRPSLATLYKKARDKGLVAPSPQGYF